MIKKLGFWNPVIRTLTNQKIVKNSKGFTLTEMLIVIALIALVGTFVTSQVVSKFNRAKVDATKIQMRQLGTILDQFRLDCGRYPTSDENLDALLEKPEGIPCPNYDDEGYVKGGSIPKDGFDADFLYESADEGKSYVISSLGNDRKEGGDGVDADIFSNKLED